MSLAIIKQLVGESLPVAAAYSFVPILIMIAYLLIARRLGAFESL